MSPPQKNTLNIHQYVQFIEIAAAVALYIFLSPFYLSYKGSNCTYIRPHEVVQNSLFLCPLFLCYFSFCVSSWIVSMYWSWLIFSSEISNLSVPDIVFLISDMVVLVSTDSIRVFFILSFISTPNMFPISSKFLNIWNSVVVAVLMSSSTNSIFYVTLWLI